jgi:proteasome lid subunit RPN8/RPN11
MNKIILGLLALSGTFLNAQQNESEKILAEGKLLFRLEKGSWYATDDMLSRFKSKKDSVGGYLSYETAANKINTIFFDRFDEGKILIRYQFDSMPEPKPIKIDLLTQKATALEKSLIAIRQDAKVRAYSNKDNFFRFYENTAFNFIPVINKDGRNVYVLTGPQGSGEVLIGNDYKLYYNEKNEFVKEEKIHNSLLRFPYTSGDKKNPAVTTYHSHVVTPYISSTDICTLLLYKDYVEWKQHLVVSQKDVSIFNLEKESLVTMKIKDWKKKNRKKNK